MHTEDVTAFQAEIYAMDAALALVEQGMDVQVQLQIARRHLARAISEACEMTEEWAEKRIFDIVDAAAHSQKGRRASAILMVRALSIEGLLPFEEDQGAERKAVALVEDGFGDQCKALKFSEKRQTFEKINALNGFHETICANLQVLRDLPPTLTEIDSVKADILKALRQGICNAYLQPYDWTALKGKISNICDQISELVNCKDASYKARFDQLCEACDHLNSVATANSSFVTRGYVKPFVRTIELALCALKDGAVDQFNCRLEPKRKIPNVAEKRYPLHQVDKLITITIPLTNTGPGMAVDVSVELDCGASNALVLESQEIFLGDIPPGEFAVSFKAIVVEPVRVLDMALMISWGQLFGDSQSVALDVRLSSQDPLVDWSLLEQLDPYSLEVAEGHKFVGRGAKVQAIGNRLLKAQMSSTYITGQKRIGKTSLAQAVLRYVATHARPPISYETFYLEWGEYCAADATSTIRALGEQVYMFLRAHLVPGTEVSHPSFDGSLAPLNNIVKLLEATRPEKRFVIVLDEFDEIHSEMYRFGALAEAFFANLRTLGARKNLAFVLVGGEKMPFIIGAQGDQLNKFGREPLDYFSRSDEWEDYVELVVGPVRGSLNWEESALNELYSVTNGHPYYTKLLCAKIFSTAVAQRDTDIIVSDVRQALNGRVSELDTNAFAHFWKDGINAERDESEVIELKRLRLLVAFGRALRSSAVTRVGLIANISGTFDVSTIGPLIEDFCRRDILEESAGEIVMRLHFFERWIRDVGITKLISSTLADDLETELQKASDLAYVRAGEIENLVRDWPLYRGREITGESVRAWLDQVENPQDQRLLFKILVSLRFVTTAQICEHLSQAHERVVARGTPPRLRENKVEKRRDLLVTYLDGPGKSGTAYARAYAKENELLMDCVLEPARLGRRLLVDGDQTNAVVIVDDLAGTGGSIAGSLEIFLEDLATVLVARGIPVFLIVMFATEDAQRKIKSVLNRYVGLEHTIYVCEALTKEHQAFQEDDHGFWRDLQERDRAKALCLRLGTGLYRDPLGFGSQGLLIAFPETCPNNSLPILFASRSGAAPWNALLQRPAS